MSETLEIVGIEFDTTTFEGASKRVQQELGQLTQAENAYAEAQRLSREEVAAAAAEYDNLFGAAEDLNEVHAEAIRWNQHFDQVVRSQTEAVEEAHAEALRMNAALDDQNKTVLSSVTGLGRLNNTLASSARQLAGVHPVVGQLVSSLGGLALGAGVTTGVLLFLTALAAGWKKVSEAEREAREETERSIASLDKLVADSGPGPLQGDVRGSELRLAELQEEMAVLRQKIAFNRLRGLNATADRQQEELMELAFESAAERERSRAGIDATATVLPELSVDIPRTDEARERAMKRRHDLAVKNLQAGLAEIERAEQDAAAAALEHDQAVEKLTGQLELERIALTDGEAAAFRASLAMQGWTAAEIEAAETAFLVNQALREQQEVTEEMATRTERAMKRMSDGIVDSLFDIADGTDSVVEAFADMVESIVSEMAREDLQRGLSTFLGWLGGGGPKFSADEVGAAIDFSEQITPDFGVASGGMAPGLREVSYQTVNLHLHAIDGRNAAQFLEQNRGKIAQLVSEARRESSMV